MIVPSLEGRRMVSISHSLQQRRQTVVGGGTFRKLSLSCSRDQHLKLDMTSETFHFQFSSLDHKSLLTLAMDNNLPPSLPFPIFPTSPFFPLSDRIPTAFSLVLPYHHPLMAAGFTSAKPQSEFKPLNPNADPFLSVATPLLPPPPFAAYTPAPPLHVDGSLMPGYGDLYYPRAGATYYWQFHPYPVVGCHDLRPELIWPYQVGFGNGPVRNGKHAGMEIYEAFGDRNSNSFRRDFVVSSRPRREIKPAAQWVEKKEVGTEKISSDADAEEVDLSLKIAPCSVDRSGITTVMIRNIPNQFKRRDLLQLLDRYCHLANQNSHPDFCTSEYDFVYLPMDFRRSWYEGKVSNLGYAFVNFTSSAAASQFCSVYHNHKWEVNVNKKICEITDAKIQGKEALKNTFKNKIFWCRTDQYLPVILSPASDGYRRYRRIVVGKRIPRAPRKPLKKLCC